MDFDINAYYAEQEDRMNLPDESMEDYAERVSKFKSRCVGSECQA